MPESWPKSPVQHFMVNSAFGHQLVRTKNGPNQMTADPTALRLRAYIDHSLNHLGPQMTLRVWPSTAACYLAEDCAESPPSRLPTSDLGEMDEQVESVRAVGKWSAHA